MSHTWDERILVGYTNSIGCHHYGGDEGNQKDVVRERVRTNQYM